jgi:hypothetical protein
MLKQAANIAGVAMLNLNPDTVCFLILKAHVFHSKEEVTLPDVPDSPADDWALQALANHAGDTVFQEFSADEWVAALQEARRNRGENTAEYLNRTPAAG